MNTTGSTPPDHEFPLADTRPEPRRPERRRRGGRGGMLLSAAALALALATAVLVTYVVLTDELGGGNDTAVAAQTEPASSAATGHEGHAAMTEAPVGGETVEPFERVDPNVPAVPAGKIKKFKLDVYEHVTRVSDDLQPARIWSYAVNGVFHRGTGVSTPMVVNEGDRVEITLNNGLQKEMQVQYPHSVDFHSAEVAPNQDYKTIGPGETYTFRFTADHPGVFMYHCATDPVLMHTAAGMSGMMLVKPKNLAPVDRELWITQQEYYLGPKSGDNADLAKAEAKQPDVIAFNGYANQYSKAPIAVKPHERIRMYVLNAGPSIWTAFHVIGTVFDRTVVEGTVGHSVQTINLAPSQGGWVEFTLERKGTYPFVDHAFADMGKGAAGVLAAGVPAKPGMGH